MEIKATVVDFRLVIKLNEQNGKLFITASNEDEAEKTFEVSQEEAAAIMALFIAGDEWSDEELRNDLYYIAETAIKDWPIALRPIP